MKYFDVMWFTGQSGAGKTELGKKMQQFLAQGDPGRKYVIIDGDDIRTLFENTDYSISGRRKNVEFVHKLCLYLNTNGIVPIVCMVSPFLDQRDKLKATLKVLEIYVFCKEIRGRENFHVDYYEKPQQHYYEMDTTQKTVQESFDELLKRIKKDELPHGNGSKESTID